jgi:phosphatidylserine decarboxylase
MTHDGVLALASSITGGALWLLSRKWRLPHPASALVIFCSGIGAFSAGSLMLVAGLATSPAIATGVICQFALFMGSLMWLFYRDPERICAANPLAVVAPADGSIIYIKLVPRASQLMGEKGGHEVLFDELTEAFADKGDIWLVGTSMVFTDVHVNRAPIEGIITLRRCIAGRFLSLRVPEARSVNERASMIISSGSLDVAVIQIASRLVRRIVPYVDVGQRVKQGQRIGMIRFGSQVDLVIPIREDMKLRVNVGDRVVAGETILCTWQERDG